MSKIKNYLMELEEKGEYEFPDYPEPNWYRMQDKDEEYIKEQEKRLQEPDESPPF